MVVLSRGPHSPNADASFNTDSSFNTDKGSFNGWWFYPVARIPPMQTLHSTRTKGVSMGGRLSPYPAFPQCRHFIQHGSRECLWVVVLSRPRSPPMQTLHSTRIKGVSMGGGFIPWPHSPNADASFNTDKGSFQLVVVFTPAHSEQTSLAPILERGGSIRGRGLLGCVVAFTRNYAERQRA